MIDYPTLSLKERDRRWTRTREMMRGLGLECLVVAGLKGRERYEGYLSNECIDGIVVFPAEGEPVYLTWGAHRVTRRLGSTMRDVQFWIDDVRVGPYGPGLVSVLQEGWLDQASIGVVGLESKGPAEMEGIISFKTWSHVLGELPRARFVDVSRQFAELMIVKSQEELALVRFSAAIGERACETMMKVTKPGATETDIYAAVMHVIHSHAAMSVAPHFILSTGPDHLGWSAPFWTYWGGRPRAVQAGDLVQAEIFPCYGGMETQQQMAIALRPVMSLHEELATVARRAYEAGLKTLRPGITFQEVCDAMEAPLAEAECWHLTPLIHSLTPTAWVSYIGMAILERLPGIDRYKGIRTIPPLGGDLTIKPGMVFELEPNACRGNHRVNIGGAVIVTEHGVEELNSLPTELRVV